VHTLLALLQLIFVCLFLFFAVADPAVESVSSRVGQSICLAISGFIGIASWSYARKKGFAKTEITEAQKDDVGRSVIIEPVTALLNTGLGFVGPGIWTLGWFVIPLVLVGARRLLERVR
jgi:TRAP-type C4-dicarboxylate transport system permease small subunit